MRAWETGMHAERGMVYGISVRQKSRGRIQHFGERNGAGPDYMDCRRMAPCQRIERAECFAEKAESACTESTRTKHDEGIYDTASAGEGCRSV